MFGPDTPLVMDALQMVGIAVAVTAGGAWLVIRRKHKNAKPAEKADLEDRVRVLERIATDRSIDLANEIENLRDRKAEGEGVS